MSCGPFAGSTATRIVCARSAALMPVVTPSRASMVTVNGVAWAVSFCSDMSSRPSSSQRSGVSARQIQPRAWRGHEVDGVGRHELGGHHEVALVLAVLVVDDDDHLAGGDVLERLLDAWRTDVVAARLGSPPRASGPRPMRGAPPTSFSTYLARMSTSRLTGVPGAAVAEVGALERLGDERDVEGRLVDARHGERDAVHRDRALLDHVAQQLRVGLRPSRPARSRRRGRPTTAPTPSTWPCTKWPPRRASAPQRAARG